MTELSVSECLQNATLQLQPSIGSEARLEADLLLAHILEKDRSWLFAWPEYLLTRNQTRQFEQLLADRIAGHPISYLTGTREFWGLTLKVTPATLIPRADTELLIETALAHLPENHANIIDLGTGSGAIAIALANERPNWQIHASDISKEALAVAAENCQKHAPDIQLKQSHWLDEIHDTPFDLIISNPPYIASQDPHLQQGDLRYEPPGALSSGSDGLDDIRDIIQQAPSYLIKQGWLMLEHGYDQAAAVQQLLKTQGFSSISSCKDLADLDRVTIGQYCK